MQIKQEHLLQGYLQDLLNDVSVKGISETDEIKIEKAGTLENTESKKEEALSELTLEAKEKAKEKTNEKTDSLFYDTQWKEKPFQALVFSVGELKLAAPLIMLNRVQVLDKLSLIQANRKIDMGMMTSVQGCQIKVLDTMQLMMPEKNSQNTVDSYQQVIMVEGKGWGLAVTDISDSIHLNPSEIQWRGEESKRPWIAGIIREKMCCLLDLQRLDKLLTDKEK